MLLACLVTLGGLMAVSPAVRAAVLGWFHQVQEDLVTFINPKRTVAEDPPGGWRLSEIPEGFVLTDVSPRRARAIGGTMSRGPAHGCGLPSTRRRRER